MRQRASEQPVGDVVLPGMPTICVGARIVKPAQDLSMNDSDYAALLSSLPWPYHIATTAGGQMPKEQEMGKLLVTFRVPMPGLIRYNSYLGILQRFLKILWGS